jgi:hypothetical protein
MDRNGEPCIGDYDRDLVCEDNFKGLCELPYPRELIKRTIDLGCGNRNESVRYSNFICEWVKRKAGLMYKCPTLKSLCAELVPYDESLPEDIITLILPPKVEDDSELPPKKGILEEPVLEAVWNRVRLINYESRFVLPEEIDIRVQPDVPKGDVLDDQTKAAFLHHLSEIYRSRVREDPDFEEDFRDMEDVD